MTKKGKKTLAIIGVSALALTAIGGTIYYL